MKEVEKRMTPATVSRRDRQVGGNEKHRYCER
jgi:hypothetical protein